MSTYAVFGMTRDWADRAARKATGQVNPDDKRTRTIAEWEAECVKVSGRIMSGGRVVRLSAMFDAPQYAREFLSIAAKLESRDLHIRTHSICRDRRGQPIMGKSGPKKAWAKLEEKAA
jgi:hypothetical protein